MTGFVYRSFRRIRSAGFSVFSGRWGDDTIHVLLEDGDILLQEDGFPLELEG